MIDRLLSDPVGALQQLVLMAPAILVAVTVHEVAHGWVADRLGDPTARMHGRLTLNPLPHIDPLGALAFVLAGFGWAKPVPVDPRNLRHPVRDMALVGAAGPLSNFLLAFLGLLVLRAMPWAAIGPFVARPLFGMLQYVYLFNLALGIFNLIPLPPLDGGHFLPYLLPRGAWHWHYRLAQYGPMILLLLVISGAAGFIIGPVLVFMDRFYRLLVAFLL
ncbi:MAG: site-2 protease family protein [Candidatus Rokubacteria bacterium]|nr:site-2 protease family protein [Candidatus Rokubacteria bacterium]